MSAVDHAAHADGVMVWLWVAAVVLWCVVVAALMVAYTVYLMGVMRENERRAVERCDREAGR